MLRAGDVAARVERHDGSDARQREVAVSSRHLLDRPAAARRHRRHGHVDDELAGLEAGGEEADEEVGRGNRPRCVAAPHADRGVERQHHRRQLGGRIGVREAAADGAAVADLRVGDERHRAVQRAARARATVALALDARAGASWRRCAGRRRRPSMPASSPTPLRSTSTAGCASRKFIAGTRLWPPARTLASSPCSASSASASSSVCGREYVERRRLHGRPPRPAVLCPAHDLEQSIRRERDLEDLEPRRRARPRPPARRAPRPGSRPASPAPLTPSGFPGDGVST